MDRLLVLPGWWFDLGRSVRRRDGGVDPLQSSAFYTAWSVTVAGGAEAVGESFLSGRPPTSAGPKKMSRFGTF